MQAEFVATPFSELTSTEWLLLRTAYSRALAIWVRYIGATLLVLVGFGLRLALFGPGPGYPYLLFFPTVVAAAAFFDRGSGFYAAALTTALAALSLSPSLGLPAEVSSQDFIAAPLYLGLALLSAYLVEELHTLLAGALDANRDLTQRNAEQALALQETFHRIQNDLHILILTISQQAKHAGDPAVCAALREAEGRVWAFSRVNRRLHMSGQSAPGGVNATEFLTGLLTDMRQSTVGLKPVAVEVKIEPHALSLARAVSLGVILHELVINALKYAFPNNRSGTVRINLHRDHDCLVLAVTDDGVGMTGAALPKETGLGQQVVRSMVAQLGGNFTIHSGEGCRGTTCMMRLPAD